MYFPQDNVLVAALEDPLHPLDADGYRLIGGDADYFAQLLGYLRAGVVAYEPSLSPDVLEEEAAALGFRIPKAACALLQAPKASVPMPPGYEGPMSPLSPQQSSPESPKRCRSAFLPARRVLLPYHHNADCVVLPSFSRAGSP